MVVFADTVLLEGFAEQAMGFRVRASNTAPLVPYPGRCKRQSLPYWASSTWVR